MTSRSCFGLRRWLAVLLLAGLAVVLWLAWRPASAPTSARSPQEDRNAVPMRF